MYNLLNPTDTVPSKANGDTSAAKSIKAPKRPATTKASADSTTAKVPKKSKAKANDVTPDDKSISDANSIYDFVVKDTFGNDVPLAKYKGQVLLIVNIAARCGYTKKNYEELDELQKKYKNKDVKILSFPCNQFGGQMPLMDGDEMMAHLEKRDVNVGEVFQKCNVNGKDAAPLYVFLRQKQGDGINVKWNFVKFLVDKNGEVVERFNSPTSPLQIAPKIDELLEK
ncbi:probable phospholipid hydroperoxide glutathione peroxidase isoform X2 [Contarinia nasturtii]|uniref:probable phospholipid hydroperoxide glutathione peroxidase isoform X2 n=1 Tax=Contarinia nasturtii TaxID=265458 RepID=UPI0012D3AA91|nr:probable phospholipid hydroperoxide glutathione peroxidase isoform X2 [Contarinia nasturtii]